MIDQNLSVNNLDQNAELVYQQEEARRQAEIRRQQYETYRRQREQLDSLSNSLSDSLVVLYGLRNEMISIADETSSFKGRNATSFKMNVSDYSTDTLCMYFSSYIADVERCRDAAASESASIGMRMTALL